MGPVVGDSRGRRVGKGEYYAKHGRFHSPSSSKGAFRNAGRRERDEEEVRRV